VTASRIFAPGVLDGHVAIVTGGGTGLGKAAAVELAACGASVVIAGRRADVLERAAAEIGSACTPVAGDIRDPADARRIVEAATGRHGRVDVLVNNAGGQYFVPAEAIAQKGWNAVWRLNVGGTLTMTRAVVDGAMREAGSGTVVNITLSPHHGLAGMTHSSAARAAVEGMTRSLAAELGGHGIAVVAVAAGHFETEAIRKYPESVRSNAARTVPLQRLGEEHEHGWLVALLATPLGRAFSGSTITLDGARDNWFGPWPPPEISTTGEVPTEERRPAGGLPHA
jgi:citronellol/citronellal dehydrogenase